jgi:hypothetical protein
MMDWLDVVVTLVTIPLIPFMLWDFRARARRRAGIPTPTSLELLAWLWDGWSYHASNFVRVATPWATWVRWAVLRILQPAIARPMPAPPFAPPVATVAPACADDAPDEDEPAPPVATPAPIPPGNRAALIEALVAAEWTVGQIRATLKGDNGAIGQEVEAVRQRLNLPAPPRLVTVRGGKLGVVDLNESKEK